MRLNCITKEEYQTLKKYGSYPTCNLLRGEGLDMLDGWCACGCFHPQTKLSAFDKLTNQRVEKTVHDILTQPHHLDVVHLRSEATLSDFSSSHSPIRLTTKGEEQRRLFVVTTNTNQTLMVTATHPILTTLLPSRDLRGMNFVRSFWTNSSVCLGCGSHQFRSIIMK